MPVGHTISSDSFYCYGLACYNMLGPKGSSLKHKLGGLLAHEMPLLELEALVTNAQNKRSLDRSVARAFKIISDDKTKGNKLKRSRRPFNLEALGLSPHIADSLRKQWPDKTDADIGSMLEGKGLL